MIVDGNDCAPAPGIDDALVRCVGSFADVDQLGSSAPDPRSPSGAGSTPELKRSQLRFTATFLILWVMVVVAEDPVPDYWARRAFGSRVIFGFSCVSIATVMDLMVYAACSPLRRRPASDLITFGNKSIPGMPVHGHHPQSIPEVWGCSPSPRAAAGAGGGR